MTEDLFTNDDNQDLDRGGDDVLNDDHVDDNQPDPELEKWMGKDHNVVAKAKVDSDRYIRKLQEELNGMRKELNTRISLEEFLEKTNKERPSPPERSRDDNQYRSQYDMEDEEDRGDKTKKNQGNEVDLSQEVEKTLNQKLAEREAIAREQQHLDFVKSEATKALGPEYPYLFSQKAKEMGLSTEYLQNMAKEQPKAFLSLMLGQDYKKADTGTPPGGSVSGESRQAMMDNHPITGKKFSDFEEIRKNDPKRYWTPSVQNELFKAAKEADKKGYDFYGS